MISKPKITLEEWKEWPIEGKTELLSALAVRYRQGDCPTYTAAGSISLAGTMNLAQPMNQVFPVMADDAFSPCAVRDGHIVMTPVGNRLMAKKVRRVRVSPETLLKNFDGFGEHLYEIQERLNADILDAITEKRKHELEKELFQEAELQQFLQSDEWGAY